MGVDLGIGRENVEFAFAMCRIIHKESIVLPKTLQGT